jgi:Ca2+-binding EF-hand superfamily protein
MRSFGRLMLAGALLGGVVLASLAFAAGTKSTAMSEFASMDANRDGKVMADEHAAAAKKMFDAMDANRDGKVTAAEMTAAQQKVTGRKPAKSVMSSAEKIKAIDTDGDGVLAAAEHAAGSRAMFEKMDTDKDGALTKAEFDAGHAALAKK